MLDYTDIPSVIEDAQNALHKVRSLVRNEYDNVFSDEDNTKYKNLLENLDTAKSALDEACDINEDLSNAYEKIITT